MPIKVRFQRYIVGRPNLLRLKVKLTGRQVQPLIENLDVEVNQFCHEVEVWCINDEYPPILEIDARLLFPEKPFKYEDLAMMLPEGMWLHRKYDNMFRTSIVTIGENYNYLLANTLMPFDLPSQGKTQDEDSEEQGLIKKEQEYSTKKKSKGVSMPFAAASAKKLMQTKSEGADAKAVRKSVQARNIKKDPKKVQKIASPAK